MSAETARVRQIRLAKNEALFREINERIEQLAEQRGSADDRFNFGTLRCCPRPRDP